MSKLKTRFTKKYIAYVVAELNKMERSRLIDIEADLGLEAYIQLELSWDGFTLTNDESELLLEMADAGEMTVIDEKISQHVRLAHQL